MKKNHEDHEEHEGEKRRMELRVNSTLPPDLEDNQRALRDLRG